MRRRTLITLLAGLMVVSAAEQAAALPPGFHATPVLTGLSQPTSVRFAPAGGPVFVAEKRGVVKAFDSLADPTATTVVDLRTDTMNVPDRGLLGLAVDPGWPGRPYIYVLYTRDADIGGASPKFGTAGADADPCPTAVHGLRRQRPAVAGPGRPRDRPGSGRTAGGSTAGASSSRATRSATCASVPTGMLYVSAGEGASFNNTDWGQTPAPPTPAPAAIPSTRAALCARRTSAPPAIRLATAAPSSASAPMAAPPEIVAYGLRNPFRFAVRPGTNELWVGDVGARQWEELDRIAAPSAASPVNFGWPCYEGPGSRARQASTSRCATTLYTPGDAAWARPYWTYNHGGRVDQCVPRRPSSVSGVAFASDGGGYPGRLPRRRLRLGLLARLHLVPAARRQRAARPGTGQHLPCTAGRTLSSSRSRPTGASSTPTSTTAAS